MIWTGQGFAPLTMSLLAIPIRLAQGADERGSGQAQATLGKLVAMQRAWGIRMNARGATLDLKELSRVNSKGAAVTG